MNSRKIVTGKAVGAVVLMTALLCWGGRDNRSRHVVAWPQSSTGISIEMVRIPGGTFMMGSNFGESEEKPAHQVTVKSFYLGTYEVTQSEWESVMGSKPSRSIGSRLPVEMVNWNDIQSYIQKLNAATGQRYRLPTEAEWEYACRAGTTGDRYGELKSIAWADRSLGPGTSPVGGKEPNAFGLYDMLGNVLEWCQDWYAAYSAGAQNNPTGAASGSRRVNRGGSWLSDAGRARASFRGHDDPAARYNELGFRLARD
jgi:formylglycine-generating enzyme required for sulfatase activity